MTGDTPMRDKALAYLSGFFKEGTPQSMARLCSFLLCFTSCLVAVIGACRKYDTSALVIALGASGVGSLFSRKKGPTDAPTPDEVKG